MENDRVFMALGSYTAPAPHVPDAKGRGIEIVLFDENTGQIVPVQTIGEIDNPSYLCWNSPRTLLHAVCEIPNGNGIIVSYLRNGVGIFTSADKREGPGRDGCFVSIDSRGDSLFAVSYSDGTSIGYDLSVSGSNGRLFHYAYKGKGPLKDRQEGSHAHQILPDPTGEDLYVCDLGSDTIWLHRGRNGFSPAIAALKVPGGYGPRHLVFDGDGKHAFILCELKPRLLIAEIQSDDNWKIIDDLPVGEVPHDRAAAPAAIKIHTSGRSLAVSNRFADRIEIYSIVRNDSSVSLRWTGGFPSGGKTPRDICFSPSGRWLLIANQDSHNILIQGFDGESGLPVPDRSAEYQTGSPVCIVPLL